MIPPMMKKALGGSSIRCSGSNPPPSAVVQSTFTPSRLPCPKSRAKLREYALDRVCEVLFSPSYEQQDATQLAEQAVGRTLSPGEVSDYWKNEAFAFIRSEPLRWLGLEVRKLRLALNAREIIDTEDISAYAEWSWSLQVLRHLFHFGVLVPLALLGIVLTWKRSPRPWPPLERQA